MIEKIYYLYKTNGWGDSKLIFKSNRLEDIDKVSIYLTITLKSNEMFVISEEEEVNAIIDLISEELICEILNN